MSSDDQQPIRTRTRTRRRAMTIDVTPVETEHDVFDPGPMVNYPPLPIGPDGLPQSPAIKQRIRDLRALDRRACRDFILRTLHAFLLAHRPMDEIARTFGVSVQAVYKWRTELYNRISQELIQRSPTDIIGRQIAHYERIKAHAWQQASRIAAHVEKRGWVTIAMNAEKSVTDLYERCGILSSTTMRPIANTDDAPNVRMLNNLSTAFLTGGYAEAKKKIEPLLLEHDFDGPIDETDYLL